MKRLLIVFVLAVTWLAWKLTPRDPESVTSTGAEIVPPGARQIETPPINTRQPPTRTNQFDLSRHTSAPETNETIPAEPGAGELQRQQKWERRRQELREQGQYPELFAKEDEWTEKSKALKTGMTLQEIVAVMGLPTEVTTWVGAGPEHLEPVSVPTNALTDLKITLMAYVYYSPDGKIPTGSLSTQADIDAAESPFKCWKLILDEQGKLTRLP